MTLLKYKIYILYFGMYVFDHILYLVSTQGQPYSIQAYFGLNKCIWNQNIVKRLLFYFDTSHLIN